MRSIRPEGAAGNSIKVSGPVRKQWQNARGAALSSLHSPPRKSARVIAHERQVLHTARRRRLIEGPHRQFSRGVPGRRMGRCARIHRFTLILCILLCAAARAQGLAQMPPAKGTPPATPRAERVLDPRDETPLAAPATPQKTETEKYTLSQDRYEKAIAYSRAGYTLYFVMSFFDILVMILVLKLGVAAKFRDFAEDLTGSRFRQGLVYIPALVLTLHVVYLPLRLYGHSLSLRYAQSLHPCGSSMCDCPKG